MAIPRIVDLRAVAGLYGRHRGFLRDESGRASSIDAILWSEDSSNPNHDNICYVRLVDAKRKGKNNCFCPLVYLLYVGDET